MVGSKAIQSKLEQFYPARSPKPVIAQVIDLNSNLTEEKCVLIKKQADKILEELNLENVQNKSIAEQKKAAYAISQYIALKTLYDEEGYEEQKKIESTYDADINSLYATLCQGRNLDITTSESTALNYLYQQCGLDSKQITIEKICDGSSVPCDAVLVNFNDGQAKEDRIVNSLISRLYFSSEPVVETDQVLIPRKTYLEKNIGKHEPYKLTEKAPLILINQATQTTDQGLER